MALTAESQAGSTSKSTIILAVVIAMHLLLFWALESGMARKAVELLPADIQTKFIEEKKPDEPPPPPPPPPPEVQIPPPFIPPPEVTVASPPVSANVITNVVTERPPVVAPPVMAPTAPPKDVVVLPKQDPKRPVRSIEDYYPATARRQGQEGTVIVAMYVQTDGRVTDAKVDTSSGFEDLDEGAVKYVKTWRLLPGTRNGTPEAMWHRFRVTFKLTK